MKKRSFNDNPILHIVLGVFLLLETLLFLIGFFSADAPMLFGTLTIFNMYLCYFHFSYSYKMRKEEDKEDYQEEEEVEEKYEKVKNSKKTEDSNDVNYNGVFKGNDGNLFFTDSTSLNTEAKNEEKQNDINKAIMEDDSNNTRMPNSSEISDFFK